MSPFSFLSCGRRPFAWSPHTRGDGAMVAAAGGCSAGRDAAEVMRPAGAAEEGEDAASRRCACADDERQVVAVPIPKAERASVRACVRACVRAWACVPSAALAGGCRARGRILTPAGPCR